MLFTTFALRRHPSSFFFLKVFDVALVVLLVCVCVCCQLTFSLLAVYVVCRRGNNSQLAVERMRSLLPPDWPVVFKDIVGGLQAWSELVDPQFPIY